MKQLTPQEQTVYDIILHSPKKITQQQIAKLAPQLGSHEKHEGYMTQDSTLRKIRQIIRTLRISHGLFILSDKTGYWIMKDKSEARQYVARIEKTAKAQAKAWHVTYQAMRRNFGINSEYFDKQIELF